MCSRPWHPPGEVDCVRLYQQNDFPTSYLPHLFIGGIGVVLVIALLILRRSTALGAPLWTPKRSAAGLVFAVPFGLTGVALVLEGIQGIRSTSSTTRWETSSAACSRSSSARSHCAGRSGPGRPISLPASP